MDSRSQQPRLFFGRSLGRLFGALSLLAAGVCVLFLLLESGAADVHDCFDLRHLNGRSRCMVTVVRCPRLLKTTFKPTEEVSLGLRLWESYRLIQGGRPTRRSTPTLHQKLRESHWSCKAARRREQRPRRHSPGAIEQRDLDRLNEKRDRDYHNQMRIALAMSNSLLCKACEERQCAQEAEVCAECNSTLPGFKRGSKHLHSRQFFYAMPDGCDCTDCTNENQPSVDQIWQLCEEATHAN